MSITILCPNESGLKFSPMLRGTGRFLLWLVRQAALALTFATLIYGTFFVLLCFGSVLPAFSRTVIFDSGTVRALEIGYVVITAFFFLMRLLFGMGQMVERTGPWLIARYPWLATVGLITFLIGAVTLMTYVILQPSPHIVPPPAAVKMPMPSDRVLLHFNFVIPTPRSEQKLAPLWGTRNLAGKATIKSLGHGRYMVQMLSHSRSAD
ncbi:hypothetical protein [Acidithiobacillus ferriphilus]|uniref:hypothetical protein n=1 Tax=Acidithiobacillus ferriphilus TaxID=1689834 RepID=UPI001C071C85|nr:hypothetical protein [Acidithiobacillus ferriphilus]MBU2853358.1 hypothetical protein [Acidithiobacillus ferriphilus]